MNTEYLLYIAAFFFVVGVGLLVVLLGFLIKELTRKWWSR
jgi:hypothetical protein